MAKRVLEAIWNYKETFMSEFEYWEWGPESHFQSDPNLMAKLEVSLADYRDVYQGDFKEIAFILGVIFDGLVPYERAWASPVLLKKKLGSLELSALKKITENKIRSARCGVRFPPNVEGYIRECSKLVSSRYGGNAGGVWENVLTSGEVIQRFQQFKGISQKKARMAAKLLLQGSVFHAPMTFHGLHELDVPVDRHVARVFVRTGLAKFSSIPSPNALICRVTAAAREHSPDYPAKLDDPTFYIGRNYCFPASPNCSECPLRSACPKLVGATAGYPLGVDTGQV